MPQAHTVLHLSIQLPQSYHVTTECVKTRIVGGGGRCTGDAAFRRRHHGEYRKKSFASIVRWTGYQIDIRSILQSVRIECASLIQDERSGHQPAASMFLWAVSGLSAKVAVVLSVRAISSFASLVGCSDSTGSCPSAFWMRSASRSFSMSS